MMKGEKRLLVYGHLASLKRNVRVTLLTHTPTVPQPDEAKERPLLAHDKFHDRLIINYC